MIKFLYININILRIKFYKIIFSFLLIPFLRTIYSKEYREPLKETNNQNMRSFQNNKVITIVNNKDLKKLLIENNDELKKYLSQIKQSDLLLKAKISEWSPRANISSASIPSYATGNSYNKLSSDTATKQFKIGLDTNIEWDIIKPERRLEINIAREKLNNARTQYKLILKNIYLDSLKKFYSVQAAQEEIRVAKKAIEISQVALDDSENRFSQGIGNKLDVLESKTQLRRDQITLLNKQELFKENKNKLAEILNLKDDFKIEDNEVNFVSSYWNIDQENTFSASLLNSEEIEISTRNIDINNDESLVILSEKKPSFTLYNKYSFSSSNGEAGSSSLNENNKINDNNNTIGLRFKLNLFDGGIIRSNYLARKNKSNELEFDLNLKRNQINREIKDIFVKYENIKEKIMLSYKQFKAAEEALFISMKRMEAGITTQREVVNTQGDVLEAETNFINSLKEYKILLAELFRLTNIDPIKICTNTTDNINNQIFLDFLFTNKLVKDCKIVSNS